MGADQDGEKNRSTVALFFSELKPGGTDKTLDEARGASCEDLAIEEIEVNCPEETDDKCPGFYYVDIPETKSPMIAHQKIEASSGHRLWIACFIWPSRTGNVIRIILANLKPPMKSKRMVAEKLT
jgi:hypothetical protein